MNGVSKFKSALDFSLFKRMVFILTCRKDQIAHKYLDDEIWPNLTVAPEPSLIIWLNLGINKVSRLIRKQILNLFSFVIIIIGFLAIVYLNT